jgi:hypothetical protein
MAYSRKKFQSNGDKASLVSDHSEQYLNQTNFYVCIICYRFRLNTF